MSERSMVAVGDEDRAKAPRPRIGDRSLFPKLESRVYYAHAAIAPVSKPVRDVVVRFAEDLERRGATAFLDWNRDRTRLREDFARLIGASADQIALTAGTSHGLTQVALGLPLTDRDRFVTFQEEFPANITPYKQVASDARAQFILLPAPDPRDPRAAARILEEVRKELRAGARYVSVSAVQFQTGYRMPLREIGQLCRESDAFFLVDAIQAVGAVPVDVNELAIDALAVGAHKWLLGVEGAGMLFLSERLRGVLRPRTLGWLSFAQAEDFLFEGANLLRYDRECLQNARIFEGSTLNAVGLCALRVGLGLCADLTPAAIFQHVQGLHDALEGTLGELGFLSLRASEKAARSCILSFRLPGGVELKSLAAELRARGVILSTPDGLLRFAPHFANSLEEVSFVDGALREVLAR